MWYVPSREALLDAAIAHVEQHGLGELSMRGIAAAIGTSHRMLNYHFGSREAFVRALVDRVEQRQRDRLAALLADPDVPPLEQAARFTEQLLDPSLWPAERLFFEVYGQALAGAPHTAGFLDRVVTAWLEPAAELLVRIGVPREQARTHARLGLAVTRGLLLDLLATGDVAGVRAAAELYLQTYKDLQAGITQ
ncbi:transcriptional regulator, TetR family [Pseudonocardia thermophila]|uniref:Transcriptional regulator, TetR family n=1 Tax=Pseudonocardia thermophila TaxID=1848 RepID=A0A1M6R2Z0_PSETH|nr:transcriptional regulator, TetR family [Pseudonocardia thermophila]